MGFFNNKKEQTSKISADKNKKIPVKTESLGAKLRGFFGGRSLNEEDIDRIEEILIKADIGPSISYELIDKMKKKSVDNIEEAIGYLKNEMEKYLVDKYPPIERGELNIILVLGVNGVGKTTSIAKIANFYLNRKFKVLIAAADTFRAAATEQLTKWATRLDIPIIKQGEGADPASVVFDALDSAISKKVDLLLIDTAGRLHTKANLMEELKKIERIIKNKGNFIKNNLLIIDGTTGQNAYLQAESFNSLIGIDGIMVTKYDAESKGGIVFTIQKKLGIPFYFIGDGEQIGDIEEFKRHEFIEKIFG